MKNTNLVCMRTALFSSISIETAHAHCAPSGADPGFDQGGPRS